MEISPLLSSGPYDEGSNPSYCKLGNGAWGMPAFSPVVCSTSVTPRSQVEGTGRSSTSTDNRQTLRSSAGIHASEAKSLIVKSGIITFFAHASHRSANHLTSFHALGYDNLLSRLSQTIVWVAKVRCAKPDHPKFTLII